MTAIVQLFESTTSLKLFLTLAFLACIAVNAYINRLALKRTAADIIEDNLGALRQLSFQIASLLIIFTGFWVLTNILPLTLVMFLIAVVILGRIFQVLFGAIAGFSLSETKRKIRFLVLVRNITANIEKPTDARLLRITFNTFTWTVTIAGIVVPLWVFWIYPFQDATAKVWIAFAVFTLPALSATVFAAFLFVPTVSSEDIDDDVRNFYLSEGLSSILQGTVLLLFPLWVLHEEGNLVFETLPTFWITLSVPMLAFVLGYVFPFFVGLYQHRHRVRALLEWRLRWLTKGLELVHLPESDARSAALEQAFAELSEERDRRVSDSGLFKIYDYIANGRWTQSEQTLVPIEVQLRIAGQSAGGTPNDGVARAPDGPEQRLAAVKVFFGNVIYAPVFDVLWEKRNDVAGWDARFGQAYRVNELLELTESADRDRIAEFLKIRKGEVERQLAQATAAKNVLAGAIVSAFSAVVTWLFKNFESELLEFVRELV